jgi:hypothetical protein
MAWPIFEPMRARAIIDCAKDAVYPSKGNASPAAVRTVEREKMGCG